VSGFANGQSYTFTVTAVSGLGSSLPSAPSAAVTPAGPADAGASLVGASPPSVPAGATQATVTVTLKDGGGHRHVHGHRRYCRAGQLSGERHHRPRKPQPLGRSRLYAGVFRLPGGGLPEWGAGQSWRGQSDGSGDRPATGGTAWSLDSPCGLRPSAAEPDRLHFV
jgi:hypothetical protein